MPVTVDALDGVLLVRPSYDRAVLALPGGRTAPRHRATAFPATAAYAANIAHRLPDGAEWTPAALEVRARADRARAARPLRDAPAERLPELPGEGPAGWLHQRQAFAFAAEQEACGLWVAMGGGKSRVGAALALAHEARSILVTCPRTVLDEDAVWQREFDKYAPDRFLVGGRVAGRGGFKARPSVADRLRQLRSDRELARARGVPFVAVVPWDSFWRGDLLKALLEQPWDLWLADEIHRIKAPGGKASRAADRLRPRAARRVGLSGTPIPHSRLDAYAVYRALDPGVYGTNYGAFKHRYAQVVPLPNAPRAEKVVGWTNVEEFDRKFHSIAYVWEKDRAVLGLEEPVEMQRRVRLGPEAWRVYRELEEELIADVGSGVVTADNALVRLLRLQQVLSGTVNDSDGVAHRVGAEKAVGLRELLEDLPAEEPVVAFGRFHGDLDSAREAAESSGRRYAELSGRPTRVRLEGWKAGEADVLGVQLQAGSSGVDLTRARYAAYLSVGLSLGDYLQSKERLDRPGQAWPCTFVHVLAEGPRGEPTMDEEVLAAMAGRQDAVQAVLRARRRAG